MESALLINSAIVFAVALVGGVIGSARQISEEALHLALALAAGFFLGAVFLELLPSAFSGINSDTAASVGALALLGFLLVYIFERGIAPYLLGGVSDGHTAVAVTALLGLSAHSLAEGGALAFSIEADSFADILKESLLVSIVLHKFIAALALGSLLALSKCRRHLALTLVVVFALMTPIGIWVVGWLGDARVFEGQWLQAASALTAGVFLYVATADILPEVMHSRASVGWKLALLSAGVAVMWVVHMIAPHAH